LQFPTRFIHRTPTKEGLDAARFFTVFFVLMFLLLWLSQI